MHVRSLTLKGFKSFADKTTLVFDEGLNVVVGPNGSGKSNISDSILWVLGEQKARNLRGQAMEDVIFAGSFARKAVGLAEVTLTLDNTDHTLPIDFTELAITRRMYRSGESDYLINGSPARLMDIRDILYDSGLGRDTRSIISQGKLDAILSGKSDERRQLIEEAADIAKHRQRKDRSFKKLEGVGEQVERVQIIVREIDKRLRPLERQVNKAARARAIKDELHQLTVALAVEDLRDLQTRFTGLQDQEQLVCAEMDLAHYQLEEKQKHLNHMQSLLEQKGLFVGDLSQQRRRLQTILSRMDADMRLLEEKGRNMVSKLSDMRMQLSVDEKQAVELEAAHTKAHQDLLELSVLSEEAHKALTELTAAADVAAQKRRALDARQSDLAHTQKHAEQRANNETLAFVKLEESLAHAAAERDLYQNRLATLDEELRTTTLAADNVARELLDLAASVTSLESECKAADEQLKVASAGAEMASQEERRLQKALSTTEAQLAAQQQLDRDLQRSSRLKTQIKQALSESLVGQLSDVLQVDPSVEVLVEQYLGEDLEALLVADPQDAEQLISELLGDAKNTPKCPLDPDDGKATLLYGGLGRAIALKEEADVANQVETSAGTGAQASVLEALPLMNFVQLDALTEPIKTIVFQLLSSLYVVDHARDALRALRALAASGTAQSSATAPMGICYLSRDGALILPDGRIRFGAAKTESTGPLKRKRLMRTYERECKALKMELKAAEANYQVQMQALSEARAKQSELKAALQGAQAELRSRQNEHGRLQQQQQRLRAEHSRVEQQLAQTNAHSEEARSTLEAHKAAATAAQQEVDEVSARIAELTEELSLAIAEQTRATRALSDEKLTVATLKERQQSASRQEYELRGRLKQLKERILATHTGAAALDVLRLRVDPLHDRYEAIREQVLAWAARVKDRASLAEADSDSLKQTIADAKQAVEDARETFEHTREQKSALEVQLGRLEVQVEAAIRRIQETGTTLDDALLLQPVEDRVQAHGRVEELNEALGRIGLVNEVALDEYAELKERSDYIHRQLSDLEATQLALKKITRAIEQKMRRRFVEVFEQVNKNFGEMFALLFPGGTAYLELTDPDNLENTGIDIIAQPRGKRLSKTTLLSGGEKSLTALAVLFALYQVKTVPFYVFDEVEAALDDSNLSRLLEAIERLKQHTQLIVITHQRRTMEQADVLYGVSMQADGISRVVSQRLDKGDS